MTARIADLRFDGSQVVAEPKYHDGSLDGVRGLAALCVLACHLTHRTLLDPRWSPPEWVQIFFPATSAVLLFFLLSGHVIGISVRGAATGPAIKRYILRRAVRLVPINTIGVIAALAVAAFPGWIVTFGNLTFLQNNAGYGPIRVPVLVANPNLWSLNYEAFYYAAFVFVWLWRPRIAILGLGVLAIALAGWWLPIFPRFIAAYACGGVYWLAGLALAWLVPRQQAANGGNWPAAAIVGIILAHERFLAHDLSRIGFEPAIGVWVSPEHLEMFPVLLWLFSAFARRETKLSRAAAILSCVWLAAHLLWRWRLAGPSPGRDLMIASAAFLAALVVWRWRPGTRAIDWFAPVGGIAYAIYAFGWPIQYGLRQIWPDFAGSALTYGARVAVVVCTTLLLAWITERLFQPRIRDLLIRPTRLVRASPETAITAAPTS